ncbi:nitroreductase family deazaflavin-dependent oxidoreductase [Mycobacterium sp. CVI_P3]|uniref:Nitroreductase family deazaflavin-dependent oxidoreductase n=1 Tax=Mycobacterium pinniadriaticum TaxID=2994102 RepID=A0ABT3SCN4_9MYCO|nr:nitroreductase family deazaflavin-dependent oxidoreductase [Mycobacterium pinniadriaticum]MCX2930829.1 nitroreductase family deazaflavin-dependent oxidoreductase [Mycobacterium pinniadriaticum]MCX2937253.1 nitroreductase family deazaflavin-dependent oxidoreductase [Mycobacterium pinniadriaticum]
MTSLAQRALTTWVQVHDALYQRSNGWIGHRIPGAPPSLLLHTIGAKTGEPRKNTLAYYRDRSDYLVVASNGGADRNPAWYHNLRAQPNIEINVGPKRLAVTAHIVLPDDPDYARLWQLCDSKNAGRYAAYQRGTKRPIPVVRLTP